MIKFEDGKLANNYICVNCMNEDICKHVDSMENLVSSLPKEVEEMFGIKITCKKFRGLTTVREKGAFL